MPQLSLHSPIGDLTLSEADGAIVALDWGWGRDQAPTPLLCRAAGALQAYFDGTATPFDLPLAPPGTAFQQRVWRALLAIAPGATARYGDIARACDSAPRAVGQALAANPIPILIPCHRVVAAAGPGGYSGVGGLATKQFLLSLEARGLEARAVSGALRAD